MLKVIQILLLIVFSNIAFSQGKGFKIGASADTTLTPVNYLLRVNFEINPYKCDPNFGYMTYDAYYNLLSQALKSTDLDFSNVTEHFDSGDYIFYFLILSSEKEKLIRLSNTCKKLNLQASDKILNGYEKISSEIFESLVKKAIENGKKTYAAFYNSDPEFSIVSLNLQENDEQYFYIEHNNLGYADSDNLKHTINIDLTFKTY